MLGRRELSASQVRGRLLRKGYDADDVDEAIRRLRESGAIDDARTAAAIVRTETGLKKRGRGRVLQQIQRAGIASATAREALDAGFADIDDQALFDAALRKRLRDGDAVADDRELGRLFRFMVGQGFEPERVLRALRRRRAGGSERLDSE
jgi:regulatory protein